jgi:hypothetical protein
LNVLSVVVVNWNTREILRACLESLRRHLGALEHEVIVVDNASHDGSPDMVERDFPEVRLLRNSENLGFGRANNLGMAAARGQYLLLLNSDAALLDRTTERLVEMLRNRPDVGVVAPHLAGEDGRLEANARRFPSLRNLLLTELWLHRLLPRRVAVDLLLGHHFDHSTERCVDWLVGAFMLLRREVFEQTGGFDPVMFLYGEEIEWCRRIRERGWKIVFSPIGRVLHLKHRSANQLLGTEGRIDRALLAEDRLVRRWDGPLGGLAPLVRITGALLRVVFFGLRALLRADDRYARDVVLDARLALRHYLRRWRGELRSSA